MPAGTQSRRIGDRWFHYCRYLVAAWLSLLTPFEKIAGEGIVSSEYLFLSSFGVHGNCSAQIRCDPNFCTAVLNPYTLRPLTGLHGDQMDEILLYMAGDGAKIAGLHAKATPLKRDRLWEMLYLHPDNTLIHPSRRMFMGRQGLA